MADSCSQVKSRFTLLGGKKALSRGGGPRSGAGAGARACGPHHPPGLSKEPGEKWAIFRLCCADQAILSFVRFLFEVRWLLSLFSPEVPVQGELLSQVLTCRVMDVNLDIGS